MIVTIFFDCGSNAEFSALEPEGMHGTEGVVFYWITF